MEKHPFVSAAIVTLVMDLAFVLLLPFVGPWALTGLLFYTPGVAAQGAPAAFKWLQARAPEKNTWSHLSRILCPGNLVFLFLTVLAHVWKPESTDIWGSLVYIYFLVQLVRFWGAGLVNTVLALPCFLLSKESSGRLNSGAAFCSGLAGLYLFQRLKEQAGSSLSYLHSTAWLDQLAVSITNDQLIGYVVMCGLVFLCFCYGALISTVMLWALSRGE